MRLQLTFGLGLLFAACAGQAAEKLPYLAAGSEVYSNVTVTTVTATHVFFVHARGMGSAKLKDLDPVSQKRFRYDPDKAAAADRQQAEASAHYHQARATQALAAPKPLATNPAIPTNSLAVLPTPPAAPGVTTCRRDTTRRRCRSSC